MRRANLLTQVLVANLLVMLAAVAATLLAANKSLHLSQKPQAALVLALCVGLSIAVNVIMLQRRFRPLERLVDEMERADLSRPGANLSDERNGGAAPEEVTRLQHASGSCSSGSMPSAAEPRARRFRLRSRSAPELPEICTTK